MSKLTSHTRQRALVCIILLNLALLAGPIVAADGTPGSSKKAAPRVVAAAAAKYDATGLRAGFQELCQKLGYGIRLLEVDETESPSILYGVLAGKCDYRAIRDQLGSSRDYVYNGSTTAVAPDGSGTAFALDMIPRGRQAGGSGDRTRTMERMEALMMSMKGR